MHLRDIDNLLSHPQARLDRCCRQRRSDRLLLRGASCSGLSRPARWNTRYCSPLSRHRTVDLDCSRRLQRRAVSVECSSFTLTLACSRPLWVRTSHPLWVRSFLFFSTLVLVGAAGDFSLYSSCPSRPPRRSHWRTVRLCAACSFM